MDSVTGSDSEHREPAASPDEGVYTVALGCARTLSGEWTFVVVRSNSGRFGIGMIGTREGKVFQAGRTILPPVYPDDEAVVKDLRAKIKDELIPGWKKGGLRGWSVERVSARGPGPFEVAAQNLRSRGFSFRVNDESWNRTFETVTR